MRNHFFSKEILPKMAFKPISFWLYLVAIIAAEMLTVYSQPWAGIICYWILLIYSTIQPIFNNNSETRDLLLGLSLIPLIRIVSISLPLINLPQILWYPLIYIPLLAASIAVMYVTGLKPGDIGFIKRKLPLQILIGILAGLAIGFLEYLILKPKPLADEYTFNSIWLPALVLIATTGFVEELIFRGILQKLSDSVMGISGILYISIIFAVMHLGFYSTLDIIFVFLVAVGFALAVRKTGSLWGVIIAHGIANTILFTVAPFILG